MHNLVPSSWRSFKDKLVELESVIVSAHKKYFHRNSESR